MKFKLKTQQIAILITAIVLTLIYVSSNNSPVSYDIIGLIAFSFTIIFGYWMLTTRKETPDNIAFLILLGGIIGIIIDGYNVFFHR